MSIVSKAIAASLACAAQLHGAQITYARSGLSLSLEDIVQAKTDWKGSGPGGLVIINTSVDWLIPTADLVDDSGTLIEPEHYDTISSDVDGVTYEYKVMPFGPDELFWRWCDRHGRTYRRVFTRLEGVT